MDDMTEGGETDTGSTAIEEPGSIPTPRTRRSGSTHSWVFTGGWSTRVDDKIRCLYPGCIAKPLYGHNSNTSTIKNHLKRVHGITGGINNGSKHTGDNSTLAEAWTNIKNARTFSNEEFMSRLLRFLVRSHLPFTIFEIADFQELLNFVQCAPERQLVKLPSADTMTRKVNTMLGNKRDTLTQIISTAYWSVQ